MDLFEFFVEVIVSFPLAVFLAFERGSNTKEKGLSAIFPFWVVSYVLVSLPLAILGRWVNFSMVSFVAGSFIWLAILFLFLREKITAWSDKILN